MSYFRLKKGKSHHWSSLLPIKRGPDSIIYGLQLCQESKSFHSPICWKGQQPLCLSCSIWDNNTYFFVKGFETFGWKVLCEHKLLSLFQISLLDTNPKTPENRPQQKYNLDIDRSVLSITIRSHTHASRHHQFSFTCHSISDLDWEKNKISSSWIFWCLTFKDFFLPLFSWFVYLEFSPEVNRNFEVDSTLGAWSRTRRRNYSLITKPSSLSSLFSLCVSNSILFLSNNF